LYRERRVPTKRLMSRLGLTGFRNVGPLDERPLQPRCVTILLRQHTGAPSVAVVRAGDVVKEGQLLASIPEKALGANIHASINGTVREVGSSAIVIEA
jgi:Na+-translocating ferredoxin:NAD+ oxidoreductase RnfC subunit